MSFFSFAKLKPRTVSRPTPPILFLVFNRPEPTARVFARIRAQKPKQLFISADGPRKSRPDDEAKVAATREIVTAIDWPCEVKTLFREDNLGCGRAVQEALAWFFKSVEAGIILEDDCLPHPDFFGFCAELLEKFADDPKVATIGGTHFLPPSCPHRSRYYASKYFQMWGWATWRRTWDQYTYRLGDVSTATWQAALQRVHPNPVEARYWTKILEKMVSAAIDTWDYQIFFQAWRDQQCHIMPGCNLVSNLGFGADATHTGFHSPMAEMPVDRLTQPAPETCPETDAQIDNYIFFARFLESLTQPWTLGMLTGSQERPSRDQADEVKHLHAAKRRLELEVERKRGQLRSATAQLQRSEQNSAAPL